MARGIEMKMTPNRIAKDDRNFPVIVLGDTSPYPTVVMVTIMNQIACGRESKAAPSVHSAVSSEQSSPRSTFPA